MGILCCKAVTLAIRIRLIPAHHALRQLMGAGNQAMLSLIVSQYPRTDNGRRMKCLNQSTIVFGGAEQVARAIDAVVFYIELERNSAQGWNVRFSLITDCAIETYRANETGNGAVDRRFGSHLERTIRKAPAYWL